jgi:glycosyltransferase involved in cell wall biosynthesis
MKKLLCITPHLSTGGLPQYLVKKISTINSEYEVFVIEYSDITGGKFVVQRNRVKELVGQNFYTIGDDKYGLINIINSINPNFIHLEEMPEYFMDSKVADAIYKKDRTYKIFETCHDSSFDYRKKSYFPDKFVLVSKFQVGMLAKLDVPSEVVEYPIEYREKSDRFEALSKLNWNPKYKHVLHVGLFTARKNQKEFIEYARRMEGENVVFHCVGGLADNFKYYWEPLMQDLPKNVIVHGERDDVELFYDAADLFLFTSRGHETDKETMPLVIREAISWKLPILIYNLPVYLNYFDKFDNISYLNFDDFDSNINLIKDRLKTVDTSDIKYWDFNDMIAIVSTYTNSSVINETTEKCLAALKAHGFKTILTSHIAVPKQVSEKSDYTIVDIPGNVFVKHNFYNKYFSNPKEGPKYELNLKTEGNDYYHGPAVHNNYYNGISLAKNLGYKRVLCVNYDFILNDLDFIKNYILKNNNKLGKFAFKIDPSGEFLLTSLFEMDVNMFLSKFSYINEPKDYESWFHSSGSAKSNGLEHLYYKTLENTLSELEIVDDKNHYEALRNCIYDTGSVTDYFSVLPIENEKDNFAVFVKTGNDIDDRIVRFKVYENNNLISDVEEIIKKPFVNYYEIKFNRGNQYSIDFYVDNVMVRNIVVDDFYMDNLIMNNGFVKKG